jgi:cytochrome c5
VLRHHDLVFLKHFSLVIGFLMVVTVALIGLGYWFNMQMPEHENPAAQAKVHARIQPAGAVYAGATGAAAREESARQAAIAAQSAGFEGGVLDGALIYGRVCTTCHAGGLAGAPTLTQAAWAPRIAKGKDTLYQHAIAGFNAMPPRGGEARLSDEQVKATVDWMLGQLK